MKKLLFIAFSISAIFYSCKKEEFDSNPNNYSASEINAPIYFRSVVFKNNENFETASKTTYANASVKLTDGIWYFQDALIGTSAYDKKEDLKSLRLRNTGSVYMQFDYTKGASVISLKHAKYGTDASSTWNIQYSIDSGLFWTTLKSFTTTSVLFTYEEIPLNVYGKIRLKIQKTGGSGKLNIDNITVEENNSVPSKDDHLTLGNPSNATNNIANTNNYLMQKNEYFLSYNNSIGTANWVAWHLSSAWKGNAPRKNYFNIDNTLPVGYYKATASNYLNTGFDKGHLCPSEDRDLDSISNRVTFLMTNMIPQAPKNNQVVWKALEKYCQDMVLTKKYEMYIYAGGIGSGGIGSNSSATVYNIANGKIKVPAELWKVIVLIPTGSNDLKRINENTRVISVVMPNTQNSYLQQWSTYRVSVDYIESKTGYDILSSLPANIQTIIEQKIDNGPTIAETVTSEGVITD